MKVIETKKLEPITNDSYYITHILVKPRLGKSSFDQRNRRKSRVFIFEEGETLLENVWNRKSRPIAKYKTLGHMTLKAIGLEQRKLSWSQYAGCSCPCSPGLLFDPLYTDGDQFDIYVTVRHHSEAEAPTAKTTIERKGY